jgi:hypothetical protein
MRIDHRIGSLIELREDELTSGGQRPELVDMFDIETIVQIAENIQRLNGLLDTAQIDERGYRYDPATRKRIPAIVPLRDDPIYQGYLLAEYITRTLAPTKNKPQGDEE